MKWREILLVLLVSGFLAGLIVPSCVAAAGTMPVVRSINGPTSRDIVSAGEGGTHRIWVVAEGGNPPYTYTWLKQIRKSSSSVVQDGVAYWPTEGKVLSSGPSSSIALSMRDLDTDGLGNGRISVIVTDSSGRRALWVGRTDVNDYFVWGIELWEEDYRITDDYERAVASVHVYTLPSTFPYTLPASSTPAQPGRTSPGTLIPVKSCYDEGTRCYGGPDCINGICVDPCQGSSSPFCQCDCIVTPPEPEIPWVVIVGGLAAVAAAAAIIAKAVKGKPEQKGPKKKAQPSPIRYILQLSTNKVRIMPGNPVGVTITAWKVVGDSPPVPAPEASIEFLPPHDMPELQITPIRGSGSLESMFSVRKETGEAAAKGPRTAKVTVTAAADKTSTRAEIEVELTGVYSIEFY